MFGYFHNMYQAWIDFPQREGKLLAGRYQINRFLGMGSYGLTYLCDDLVTHGFVVVKQAKPSKGKMGRDLLRREIEIMGLLQHPAIPVCLDAFEHKKQLYMVTEYVNGQTMEDMIFERGTVLSETEALHFVRKLMEIVSFIHEKGFVHLDIRIPNVMLQGERIRLIDFGLAARFGEPTHTGALAEEDIHLRRTAESSSDLYAIGHFLLFMLYSGYEPDPSFMETNTDWEEELAVSPKTKRMLRKLLQIDPPYANTQAFVNELKERMLECSNARLTE